MIWQYARLLQLTAAWHSYLNPKIQFLIRDVNVVFATSIRTTHTKHQLTKKYEAYNRRTSLSIQILGRLGTNHRRK
jgi:hypothetical protein